MILYHPTPAHLQTCRPQKTTSLLTFSTWTTLFVTLTRLSTLPITHISHSPSSLSYTVRNSSIGLLNTYFPSVLIFLGTHNNIEKTLHLWIYALSIIKNLWIFLCQFSNFGHCMMFCIFLLQGTLELIFRNLYFHLNLLQH